MPRSWPRGLVRRFCAIERAGLQLTGEDELLSQLTKRVVESALSGEFDDHLGCDKHAPTGGDGGNSPNGRRAKTVLTGACPGRWRCPATGMVPLNRSRSRSAGAG